jgi:hypothetical protein
VRARPLGPVLLLLLAACSGLGQPGTAVTTSAVMTSLVPTTQPATTTEASTTVITEPPVMALYPTLPEGPCVGVGAAPPVESPTVTFVASGRLYEASPDGSMVRCLLELPKDSPRAPLLLWAPAGDRVFLDGEVISATDSSQLAELPPAASLSWSRPTGKALIGIADSGSLLLKTQVPTGEQIDISFLIRHDEVGYHPAGTHIFVVGEQEQTGYGIYLASNLGTDALLVADATGATVSSPAVFPDGTTLVFLAEHDAGQWHVHEVLLSQESITEFDASIAFESSRPLSRLMVSPYDGLTAVLEGGCGDPEGFRTQIVHFGEVDAAPLGWLPFSTLVAQAFPRGCDSGMDVLTVRLDPDTGELDTWVLVSGVDAAAVRAALPEPPPAPTVIEAGFA